MPLISDPDGLSQGGVTSVASTTFASASGASIVITSANVPAVTVNDYIEVRDAANAANNGLYRVTAYSAGVSITATKQALTGSVVNPVNAGTGATIRILGTNANKKNIHFDTTNRRFTFLNGYGSVTVLDNEGVIGQALYSFMKEEWKNDNDLIKFPFPMTAITPEQFEFNDWRPVDAAESTITTTQPSNTRKLIRTAGWDEVDANGFVRDSYFCWLTLGNIDFTDKITGDKPYYFFGSQAAATVATFAGPANEAVPQVQRIDLTGAGVRAFTASTFTRTTGSFVTDGFRVGDYLYIQNAENTGNNGSFLITAVAALTITVSGTPFTANADDSTALAAIDRRAVPFTTRIRVFGKTYGQSTTNDIGVTTLTNQVYRFPLSEATDNVIADLVTTTVANLLTDISVTPVAPYNDMAIGYFGTAFTRTGFNAVGGDTPAPGNTQFGVLIQADAGGASGGPPSAEQIYAFCQATLQETGNINDPDGRIAGEAGGTTIAGLLADPLVSLASTGNTLTTLGQASNPAGGGTGVAIDNFDANDTNRITQTDNDGDQRTYPFVAAGAINFNGNLSTDPDAVYRMFFTNDDAGDNTGRDFGTIGAITVQNASAAPIAGAVPQNPGGSSVAFTYAYSTNNQRGAASVNTPVPITIVAIGLETGQYVVATGTINQAVGQQYSLVAALERNYSNA